MNPVKTEDCDVLYKGPRPDIGDLWVHRIQGVGVRSTWELTEEELDLLKEGGRLSLTIMKEPIPPIVLKVVSQEESQPVGEHGWKVDLEPGDNISKEKEDNGKEHIEV